MPAQPAATPKNQGFTLVEVIVVMVILSILAALLVPSLTGYIAKAGDRAVVVEARALLMAAQTLASERYAAGGGGVTYDEARALAELTGGGLQGGNAFTVADGKVQSFTYISGNGSIAAYDTATGKITAVHTG
jgi:prepilin-type N-terminal cleavage/methylation domain-containing protein